MHKYFVIYPTLNGLVVEALGEFANFDGASDAAKDEAVWILDQQDVDSLRASLAALPS